MAQVLQSTKANAATSEDRLILALQSRSDDKAAWNAAVEVFRRAGTDGPVVLPEGFRSGRPEVRAVLEAAEERTGGDSSHSSLSKLLSDSRDYVRMDAIQMLAELSSDERVSDSDSEETFVIIERALYNSPRDTRLSTLHAIIRARPRLGAPSAVRELKASVRRGWWFWAGMLTLQGATQVVGAAYFWVRGEDRGYGHLLTGLLMLVPGVLIFRAIPYFRERQDFLRTLETLEQVVTVAPEEAKALAATIRHATRDGLPIAAAPNMNNAETLPRPAPPPHEGGGD